MINKIIFGIVLVSTLITGCNSERYYLLVGTYTHSPSNSRGIQLYDFETADQINKLQEIVASNPSFITVTDDGNFLYSVNENQPGNISAFRFDKSTGRLSFLNTVESMGKDPCYVELDKTGKWLFCANYTSGSFSIYNIESDGKLGNLSQVVQHTGHGPDTSRQQSPHVHSTFISSDNKFLFVCDLGIDKIMVYPFNAVSGKVDVENCQPIEGTPGGGPRHLAFSKDNQFIYLIEEMSGNVIVFKHEEDRFTRIQLENHLPKGTIGAGADIHLSSDGKFLYTSQRSNSTIEVYEVNKTTGQLVFKKAVNTVGNFPRNFTIHPSGDYLLAANQKSDNITIFKIDPGTGIPAYTGNELKAGIPVCLKWIKK